MDRPATPAARATALRAVSHSPLRSRAQLTVTARIAALVALVAVALAALVAQYQRVADGYMTDDAFISFRYARNLAEGLGPVWQPGDRVEGYTNFGWVLMLALAGKAGADPVDASRALGLIFSTATFALLPLLAAQLRPAWTLRWWALTAVAMAALSLNNGFSLWALAGLEAPAVAFFITAGVALHLYEERTLAAPVWSAPAFAAAALVRPDALVIFVVCAAFKCARLLQRDRAHQARVLARWAASFAVLFGAYWAWRWSYYGEFFPNTYYLKAEQSRAVVGRGWEYVSSFLQAYWIWLAAGALVSLWRERAARYRPATCLLAVCSVWLLYVVQSGGDWMPYFRFIVPLLPLIYVLIVHGAIDAADAVTARAPLPSAATWAALALSAALLAYSAMRPYDDAAARNPSGFHNPHILPGAVDRDTHRAIGEWMRLNLPPDYTVAVIASGIVPYYSRLPTIDMLGVNDEHIAHRDIELGHSAAGHEKWDGGYVISREPDVIWLEIALEREPRDSIDEYMPPKYAEWVPVKTGITQNAYVWFLYRPVAVRIEDGWLNLLVHEDAVIPTAQ